MWRKKTSNGDGKSNDDDDGDVAMHRRRFAEFHRLRNAFAASD